MKIYSKKLDKVFRLQIFKSGEERQYLSLTETSYQEIEIFVKKIITDLELSPFQKGFVTSINIREFTGAKAEKCRTISFKGLSAKETMDLIINHIENKNK